MKVIPHGLYEKALGVCRHLATGMTEVRACDLENIPPGRFRSIVKHDEKLAEIYEDAIARGVDNLVDLLTDPEALMDLCRNDVKLAGIVSNNLMWVASKRARKRYGEKVEIDHNVTLTADKAITNALQAGLDRARGLGIEVDVEDVEIIDDMPILDEPEDSHALPDDFLETL